MKLTSRARRVLEHIGLLTMLAWTLAGVGLMCALVVRAISDGNWWFAVLIVLTMAGLACGFFASAGSNEAE